MIEREVRERSGTVRRIFSRAALGLLALTSIIYPSGTQASAETIRQALSDDNAIVSMNAPTYRPSRPVIFLPGYGMKADENWEKNLRPQLLKKNADVRMVEVAQGEYRNRDAYLEKVKNAIQNTPGEVDIAGFSAGVGAQEMLYDKYGEKLKGKVIRFSAFNGRDLYGYDPRQSSIPDLRFFYVTLHDPAKVIDNVSEVRVFTTADDQSVPAEQTASLAVKLRAPLKVYPNGGHGGIVFNPERFAEALGDQVK